MRVLLNKNQKPDLIFLFTVLIMCLFGIVMISSASMVSSFEKYGSNYHYVTRQIVSLFIGIGLMIATYLIDYRFWKKNALWVFLITIGLLILVFIPGLGHKVAGAQRWIGFGNNLFQPSEVVKLGFIIYLAAWLTNKGEDIKHFLRGFLPFMILVALVAFLIIKQPDMGTMSVIVGISVAMFFVSGADLLHMSFGLGTIVAVGLVAIKVAPYRMQRVLVFLNPSADSQGAAYHINQALLAIGTGGLWGLGFGQSRQKYLYLPMAHTDSIFAIIAEELGFVRTSVVILAFLYLCIRGMAIAKNAPDKFSQLLVVGIVSWIIIQTLINIGAMLGVIPMTGVPLPFLSYGGSSLMVLLAGVGIVLNISKHSKERI